MAEEEVIVSEVIVVILAHFLLFFSVNNMGIFGSVSEDFGAIGEPFGTPKSTPKRTPETAPNRPKIGEKPTPTDDELEAGARQTLWSEQGERQPPQ